MVTGAAAAARVDDGTDPEATRVAAHYASLMHLTGDASARERLSDVLAMAGETRLRNMMEAFLVAADLADGSAADIDARVERLRQEASADGYDRFILHWAAWMHGLVRGDAGFARRWMDLQQEFLDRTGIVETWITTFSSAMTDAVDGSDVREQLARALALADREGYRAEGDCALALAYSEACRGDGPAAAELLGTAVQSRFNSTAHYVLYRLVVEPVVRAAVPPAELGAALERGQRRSAAEALAQHGIG
jgi:hypothetical protein